MGSYFDDPNREAVGLEPAWAEGSGGSDTSGGGGPPPELDDMSKEQLLEHAQQLGAKPANAGMTKDELRESIDAHQAEGG
jgi:hypothetical protein